MESTKIPNCTELCQIGNNTQIILDHDSDHYPIKIIGENNVESYKFSTYLPDCIESELIQLLKLKKDTYVLGLEYAHDDIQIGITGTYNTKLDKNLRQTMSREVLEETGLILDTTLVHFPEDLDKFDTKSKSWLCGNANCYRLKSYTNTTSNKEASELLDLWASKNYKEYDVKKRKIGLVIWQYNCRNMCEKLLNIDKNPSLTKLLKKDNITSFCVVKLTEHTLEKIRRKKFKPSVKKTKAKSKIKTVKKKLSPPKKNDIVYYMVSMEGCPACKGAKETFKKNKLKYKEIGTEKTKEIVFTGSAVPATKNAVKKFKQIKEKYDYYPKIVKIDIRTGKLVPWNKGERKGKYIGGNAELQEELN